MFGLVDKQEAVVPLCAGPGSSSEEQEAAGILGLAIGLGTQNLIKDIVSGLFFLIGDYVGAGKAKGTVEGISIRSLKLRHTRGMVHIVPFSQLGTVTNFSKDYNITKLDFRVPFDTDVDKVRKVVKKIDKEIQQDEELGPTLLGPIRCAGVLALDDSALIMRVKFKSKPGHQFIIQRQVFRRLKELFGEKGLEFATRHVMVRLPDEPVPAEPKTEAKRRVLPHQEECCQAARQRPLPSLLRRMRPGRRLCWRRMIMPGHRDLTAVLPSHGRERGARLKLISRLEHGRRCPGRPE